MKFRISFIIPLVLLLLSISFSGVFYWQTNGQASKIVRDQDLLKLKLDITRLQNILYNSLTEEYTDLDRARLNLSVTAMDTNIQTLLLATESEKVLIANRYNWQGMSAADISGYENRVAAIVKQTSSPRVFYADDDRTLLKGYYPVVLHLEDHSNLPIKRRGILYVEYSMASKLRKAQRIAFNQSVTIAAILFGISLVLALLLDFIISKRLSRLTSVAKMISSGNLNAKTNITGRDELGVLSSVFDEMIERLKHDIDRRKRAEKALLHVNENLEDIIDERTAELEEKKKEIMIVQAHAHHASKMSALGEMAGGMAHEINSPLQAITLLTYRLKKDELSKSSEQRNDISNQIDEMVYRISSIIESLRKMSRGSSSGPFETVALKDIIDNVIGITKERYFIKGINLEIIYHDQAESVKTECQQTLIGQVVINLLNNAYDVVKNLDEKWIKLEVFAFDSHIEFVVTDSGKGVDKDLKDKIFEPMFTTKNIDEGTGLGLSISLEIARKHNGSLTLDTASENTRFVLSIPHIHKEK